MLRDVIIILQDNNKIARDFRYLYLPEDWNKKKDKKQKTVSEFVSENGVKMKAMSMGKSPRGQKFTFDSVTYRPDLVWFDDLDTEKSIKNPKIITANVNFILWEVFGWVAAYCQKIFLWNVIGEDGVVPRLKKHFESDEKNKVSIFWIPIRKKGKIMWNRFVATDKEAEEKNIWIIDPRAKFVSLESRRREQGSIGYSQNYNLIPYRAGQSIIKNSDIRYYGNLPNNVKNVIGIDPAFSEKTNTDPIGITVTGHEKYKDDNYKYIIEVLELEWEDKDEDRFAMIVKQLYVKYKVSIVWIENNNGGGILARILRKKWMAVKITNSEKDKVTRLREHQWDFERGFIKFNPDDSKVWKGIEQLKAFPGAEHDDMVDSMVFSFNSPTGSRIWLA